ncbi:MAG TPA: hypothetical protein VFH63_10280 [candidate division Zixibacteria bacterium]|nr:hypothetical protein [candidate division Zixibacteria bacterium]
MDVLGNAANAGVLRYLGSGEPHTVAVERPTPDTDTWHLGAHPDVVERLWVHLNGALPQDCRILLAGGAALAHPAMGLILALALGTQYAIRLTGTGLAEARRHGYATTHAFRTVNRTLDLHQAFGPGWVFGRHEPIEADWLRESYADANL